VPPHQQNTDEKEVLANMDSTRRRSRGAAPALSSHRAAISPFPPEWPRRRSSPRTAAAGILMGW